MSDKPDTYRAGDRWSVLHRSPGLAHPRDFLKIDREQTGRQGQMRA
jgi:hypothetical protein